VGYAGGTSPSPSYRSMGDHTEVVQVEYNPVETSYSNLLDFFWANHDPTNPKACSRQYMSAIFYHTEEQKVLAEDSLRKRRSQGAVTTRLLPLLELHVAEEYHQKYLLQQEGWLLTQLQLEPEDLVDSSLAARLHGYIAGYGDQATFEAELPKLGLNTTVSDFVIKKIKEKSKERGG